MPKVFDFPSGKGKGKNQWDYNRPITNEIKRLMESCGGHIGVPTPVSCEFHPQNWSEGIAI